VPWEARASALIAGIWLKRGLRAAANAASNGRSIIEWLSAKTTSVDRATFNLLDRSPCFVLK
jgi:hypothetical protein